MVETNEQRERSEREFSAWLWSIEFVDERGKVLEPKLYPDDSADPENDRGEVV